MLDHYDFPNDIEMEKQLLSAMLLNQGFIVPKVLSILNADELYRPEHQLVFKAIVNLYYSGTPVEFLAVEQQLRKNGDHQKIDHTYLLSLIDATYTTAFAEHHAKIIKEKADLRRLIVASKVIRENPRRHHRQSSDDFRPNQPLHRSFQKIFLQ